MLYSIEIGLQLHLDVAIVRHSILLCPLNRRETGSTKTTQWSYYGKGTLTQTVENEKNGIPKNEAPAHSFPLPNYWVTIAFTINSWLCRKSTRTQFLHLHRCWFRPIRWELLTPPWMCTPVWYKEASKGKSGLLQEALWVCIDTFPTYAAWHVPMINYFPSHSLACNYTLDYGARQVWNTSHTCREQGIRVVSHETQAYIRRLQTLTSGVPPQTYQTVWTSLHSFCDIWLPKTDATLKIL